MVSGVTRQDFRSHSVALDRKHAVTVDSGIGGALVATGMKTTPPHEEPLLHIGAMVCLPIGDKDRAQIISYTAQMISAGLIDQESDKVIIACNTASTACEEACRQLTDFIYSELDQAGLGKTGDDPFNVPQENRKSIFSDEPKKLFRLIQLRNHIQKHIDEHPGDPEAKYRALPEKVHEIITPTAQLAAQKAVDALDNAETDRYYIQVDATVGTTNSGAYPEAIREKINGLMSYRGFTPQPTIEGSPHQFGESLIRNDVLVYEDENGSRKSILVQSRGLKEWVPVIEKGRLQAEGQRLAISAQEDAEESMRPDLERMQPDLEALFESQPDLNMACCTHYPAMGKFLNNLPPEKSPKDFLTQDQIVKELNRSLNELGEREETALSPSFKRPMTVVLGEREVSPEKANENRALIRELSGGHVEADIHPMQPFDLDAFKATHQCLEWNSHLRGSENKAALVLHEGGSSTYWKQDRMASPALDRANAQFVAGIPVSARAPDEVRGRFNEQVEAINKRAPKLPLDHTTIQTITQLGRLGVEGEHRGIDVIGVEHEPGLALFNASSRLASIVHDNSQVDTGHKATVGIVTGFTVVDQEGKEVGGENDGPPGAVTIAKLVVDQGTPVTIICDRGSEASVLSAASAIGLVTDLGDTNRRFSASDRIFNMEVKYAPGFSVEIVGQDLGLGVQSEPNTVDSVKKRLEDSRTKLLISIERPGPNAQGQMSSMAGADISRFNEDLSALFPSDPEVRKWETIGIGDGGNEIGMGNVAGKAKETRKPDFTPVVNNGGKIAAETKTDETVLASVSNNGGVLLTVATDGILKDLGHVDINGLNDDNLAEVLRDVTDRTAAAKRITSLYKQTIDRMYDEGMSIDGVTKRNDKTVDGRPLHRPDGLARQPLGTEDATHDDFFDRMIEIVATGSRSR